ncbi:hypothetical protein L202_04679 [Cryptococcus amylolentus CBS 6039]|uniref:Adenylate cyclase n=2 Tax=Cryptococcus amylolentus TaxID=104669 RepID=A0A1E3HME7_9TREE|nr:hypothetical protein L202_04679 [Cryptococcus amylolentus CBS 6039]ODN77508.1 hypothetical protein L202_04679 [Cryptococcus amylolentus CBS 6039]ODO05553.1 hypothetical protein I350_04605 [Cryptococcus amylolentus CBS 6273]
MSRKEPGNVPPPNAPATKDAPIMLEPEAMSLRGRGSVSSTVSSEPDYSQLHLSEGPQATSPASRSPRPSRSPRKSLVPDEHPPKRRVSPLMKRLGEEPPFMLPHPSRSESTFYPGVVIGSFAGGSGSNSIFGQDMQLDGSMDDILDPNARSDSKPGQGRQPQAGANIAPWLQDDEPPSRSHDPTPTAQDPAPGNAATVREKDKKSSSVLNHFSSVPTLPKIRRSGTADGTVSPLPASGTATHSPSGLASSSSSINTEGRTSRAGSGDSLQTLPSGKGRRMSPAELGQGKTGTRAGRFGSTASAASGTSSTGEKKKGFLGGLLKRKGPNLSLNPINDGAFDHRGSTSSIPGSTSSRGSVSSTGTRSPAASTDRPTDPFFKAFHSTHNLGSYVPEDAVSPSYEGNETPFHLDMNLDDMEGIIDPSKAGLPTAGGPTHTPPSGFRPPAASVAATESSVGSTGVREPANQMSSFGTSISSSSESGPSHTGPGSDDKNVGRRLIGEAERQHGSFTQTNPFKPGSSSGSADLRPPYNPPSPHSLQAKNQLPPSGANLPRRPSALRNVEMGNAGEKLEEESSPDGSQSMSPVWRARGHSATLFQDPFSGSHKGGNPPPSAGLSPSTLVHPPTLLPAAEAGPGPSTLAQQSLAPPGAAWAAPESWGVEADEDGPGEETTSSSDDDWVGVGEEEEDEPLSPIMASPPLTSPTSDTFPSPTRIPPSPKKAPPFGFKSQQQRTRPGTANTTGTTGTTGTIGSVGRRKNGKRVGSSAGRPGTGIRPGTSGSVHSGGLYWARIYRADNSYGLYNLPLNTTTAELLAVLSNDQTPGGQKKVATNMKLYICERGQDRILSPSEKPIAIQHRKLLQMGHTEQDNLEELGKSDLAILCRFIYQAPILPIMNPEEESSYDSFEFIDIAGRDLQTIPIFLHLHAHDIIILNVSRNPMSDIPLDFIQACTALKELRMSNMALKRVPNSIRASQTLARLDVSCNRIADLESVALNEVETLVSLKVQNNKLTSMPSYFAQMKSLKYLNISNNKFENFPAVVCEMSNLVDLDVSFNNITELPAKMSDLKSLEKLGLYSNEITHMPKSFSTLANLRILDVRRNNITDLSVVYALPNLATLQADYNNVVTLDAQLGANVRQFSVPHNSVTRFTLAPPPNMAIVTYMLMNLDLSHGKISTLADEAFSGLTNLVTLNLNFNQFTRLPTTLNRLTNLEVFSCTDNMLNTLPVGFGKLHKLRILNLHNNNLKRLPNDLWSCSSLEVFNASSNLIDAFEGPPDDMDFRVGRGSTTSQGSGNGRGKESISPLGKSMRKLFLADNRLNDDVFHWISLLPFLRVINLSFNDIYEVPAFTLSRCEKLEALYLSGNKLTSLPAEDLEKLQNLKILHLNGNKLQTLPSELGAIKTLQHLDVGSNVLKYNIANWPYDWNWNWNTSLRYLNLSGNKRLEIKPTSAQDMTHASSFRRELSDFTALSQLHVLGLMDVTLRISSLPDESDDKRVRTSFSDINNMAYGIADTLGHIDHLAMFDLVVPNFRGKDNECIFGMFGRATVTQRPGKIAKYLQEIFAETLAHHLEKLQPEEDTSEALRRTFMSTHRKCFEYFVGQVKIENERKPSWTSFASFDSMFRGWSPGPASTLKTGASGAVVYLKEKVLYVGSIGDMLVVLSRKGDAELLAKRHDPTDREEVARIRKAEAWVSTKGFVNDDKDLDISRAFGYWHEMPAINGAPEIRTRTLQESDEFVIIGNHALWQFCSYQTAVDIARTERDDPMMAAQKLRDFAISYGAEGNIMVMVVNVSDLFFGRNGVRTRGSSSQTPTDMIPEQESYSTAKRVGRRRAEEVGDRTLNRLQQEIEPPTGQVAIVFTDIVNSTYLWETNPAMPTAIKMHHNLMRRQLRLDGGYEVKTEGDSFMVSFQSVTAAVLWCFNCQIGLLTAEWPRELLDAADGKVTRDSNGVIVQRGLRVRMGVHWGSPECERDPITRRMDYYGPMVNRAARINASADGGQLMASRDVLNEISVFMEYLKTTDEQALDELQGDSKREIMELRRIGVEVRDMGDRKLKGLEVPERLHLLYPKTLCGRLEISNEIRPEVEVNDVRKHADRHRMIDVEQVHQLSAIALRLEAVCSYSPPAPTSPGVSPQPVVQRMPVPPSYLGPSIKEEMSDEELAVIVESLVGRIENAVSTLYLKNFGEFGGVLAALQTATKTDPKLIIHALSLMNGAMGKERAIEGER